MTAVLAIAAVIGLGACVAALWPWPARPSFVERLAWAWLYGYACLGVAVQLVVAATGRAPAWAWWCCLLVPAAVLLRRLRRPRAGRAAAKGVVQGVPPATSPATPGANRSAGVVGVLLAAAVGSQLAYAFLATFSTSLQWDGVFVWALKAKALLHDAVAPGSLLRYLTSSAWEFSNQRYPLGLPALEAWIARVCGSFDEQAMKVISPLFLASLAVLAAGHALRHQRRPWAWLMPLLLVSCPSLLGSSLIGYADLPLAALFGACTVAAIEYLVTAERRWLLPMAIAAAGMACTKQEGVLLCLAVAISGAAVLLAQSQVRDSWRFAAAMVCGAAAGDLPWSLLRWKHHIGRDIYDAPTPAVLAANWERATELVPFLARLLVRIDFYGLVWLVLAAVLVIRWRRLREPATAFLLLVVVTGLGIDLSPFLFTRLAYMHHAQTALDRLVMQLVPVATILIGRLALPAHERPWGTQAVAHFDS